MTDEEILSSYHNEEAVNVLENGRFLSIDLKSYQKKVLDKERVVEEEQARVKAYKEEYEAKLRA